MKTYHITLLAAISFALCLISGVSLAGEVLPLSLEEAILRCETANPGIQAKREALEAASHKVDQVRGISSGTLALAGNYTLLDKKLTTPTRLDTDNPALADLLAPVVAVLGGIPDVYLGPRNQVHLVAAYTLPLYTGGKLPLSIKAAEEELGAGEMKLESDIDDQAFSAADYYLLTLLTDALVDVNREALDTVRLHAQQARAAYEVGTVAKYDVIRADTAVKDRERLLSEAETDHRAAELALKTILALDEDTELQLTDSLSFDAGEQDPDALLALARDHNPGLKALQGKVTAAGFKTKAEKGGARPQISAMAAGQLLTGNINGAEPKWLVGLNVTMNIFDGGITGSRIKESAAQESVARLELENTDSLLELGIRTACLKLQTAVKSLEAARESIVLSKEALRLAEKRFETGNGTGIEVIDAQTALSAAEAAEKAAMYQGRKCLLTIDKYCGTIRK
ncbi:MAG: TolC family protein [Abditibacteriota bacterium]|nr:TolC family protein [Abditibacteriota bacterium]